MFFFSNSLSDRLDGLHPFFPFAYHRYSTRLSHPNEVGIDITSRTCICARSACWAAGAVADYGDVKRKRKKGETARGL